MAATREPLQFEQRDDVSFVRLARPAKRNAPSDTLVLALASAAHLRVAERSKVSAPDVSRTPNTPGKE